MLCTNMSNTQRLRDMLNLRLTADDKEIFELLDGMIGEHEGEVHRLKEENKSMKVLDAVFNPQVRLYRTDVQRLLRTKERCLLEQEWKLGIDQKYIKEEQKNLWINGQELHKVDGADIKPKLSSAAVPQKRANDGKPESSSQVHQSQSDDVTEAEPVASSSTVNRTLTAEDDQQDNGGPQPARNPGPSSQLQPDGKDKRAMKKKKASVSRSGTKGKQHEGMQASEVEFSHPVQSKRQRRTRTMTTDTQQELFECSDCDKTFEQKGNLDRHMRVHTGEKPFGCRECGKKFRQKGHLNIHMRFHAGQTPFTCSECGKGFVQKDRLNTHMRIHTGDKPFGCSECGKKFEHKGHLNTHMRIHTGEKPHACSVCDKRFRLNGELKKHMRIHTGQKPFACSECGKKFVQSVHLSIHKRIHTGEKPFVCSECGKGFGRKGHLNLHMVVHVAHKPFICSECGESFRRKSCLNVHMKTHGWVGSSTGQ